RGEDADLVDDMVGARGSGDGALVRPAIARVDDAQVPETEIGHGAGRGTDILAELWLAQDDRRAGAIEDFLRLVGTGHSGLRSGVGGYVRTEGGSSAGQATMWRCSSLTLLPRCHSRS